MEKERSSLNLPDYKQVICPIRCGSLLNENQLHLNEFINYCSSQLVLAVIHPDKNELHLFGSNSSTMQTGRKKRAMTIFFENVFFSYFRIEKQFLELQTKLLLENKKRKITEDVHWWYEAWDGTWQLYESKMANELESQHQSNVDNCSSKFTMRNTIGEKITIDLSKSLEIYGTRIKRMRRTKVDEQLPNYWTPTLLPRDKFSLDVDSIEYKWIKDSFDKTMNTRYVRET